MNSKAREIRDLNPNEEFWINAKALYVCILFQHKCVAISIVQVHQDQALFHQIFYLLIYFLLQQN